MNEQEMHNEQREMTKRGSIRDVTISPTFQSAFLGYDAFNTWIESKDHPN